MLKKIMAGVTALTIALGGMGISFADFGGAAQTAITASAATYGNFTYSSLSDGTVAITQYTGKESTVKIPSKINGKKVTVIGAYSFYDCASVKKVTVPSGVEKIEEGAFCWCENLSAVSLPDTLTSVGAEAFRDCASLTAVKIPAAVKEIGDLAFANCSALTKITVDENCVYFSSQDGVLFNKKKNELLVYPIGNERTSYTIPSSVISVYDYAFSGCANLTKITIPESAAVIGEYAFAMCDGLKTVKLPNRMKVLCEGTFSNCNNLSSVTFGEDLELIGAYAFTGCTSLKKVTLPNKVDEVMLGAFQSCTNLSAVSIPAATEVIGYGAFYNCPKLTRVTVPKTVTSIGTMAFGYKTGDVKIDDFILKCSSGTVAASYAKTNGFSTGDKISLTKCSVTIAQTRYVYTGKEIKPTVTVKYGSVVLKSGVDYTVKYTANVNTGKAKIAVTGKGKYSGAVAKYFYIVPKKQTITGIRSPQAAQFRVAWKKDSQASGYEIYFSSRADFKTHRTVTAGKTETVKAVTGVISGRTYYVKVRSYKVIDSKRVYGKYSEVRTVKCK